LDCWWALFGDRAAEDGGEETTVYTKHQELKQASKQASATSKTLGAGGLYSVYCLFGRERLLLLGWAKAERYSE